MAAKSAKRAVVFGEKSRADVMLDGSTAPPGKLGTNRWISEHNNKLIATAKGGISGVCEYIYWAQLGLNFI